VTCVAGSLTVTDILIPSQGNRRVYQDRPVWACFQIGVPGASSGGAVPMGGSSTMTSRAVETLTNVVIYIDGLTGKDLFTNQDGQ